MKKLNDMLVALLKKDNRILRTFGVLERSPLKIGTAVVLCMVARVGSFVWIGIGVGRTFHS